MLMKLTFSSCLKVNFTVNVNIEDILVIDDSIQFNFCLLALRTVNIIRRYITAKNIKLKIIFEHQQPQQHSATTILMLLLLSAVAMLVCQFVCRQAVKWAFIILMKQNKFNCFTPLSTKQSPDCNVGRCYQARGIFCLFQDKCLDI